MHKKIYESYHKNDKLSLRIIDDNNFTYINILEGIRSVLQKRKLRILDLGCGVGTLSLYMGSLGNKVLGVDVSSKAIKIAKKTSLLVSVKDVSFKQGDISNLEFKDKFDFILMTEVLEHIPDDVGLLKKIYKWLLKNGVIVISVPSKNAPLYRIGLLNAFDKNVGHLRRYSQAEIINIIKNCGFKIINVQKRESILRNFLYTFPYCGLIIKFLNNFIGYLFNKLDILIALLTGESQIIIVIKK